MAEVLAALKGAHLIAQGTENGFNIRHYLLPCGKVLEIVLRK